MITIRLEREEDGAAADEVCRLAFGRRMKEDCLISGDVRCGLGPNSV
jgi:hypothetical protein